LKFESEGALDQIAPCSTWCG